MLQAIKAHVSACADMNTQNRNSKHKTHYQNKSCVLTLCDIHWLTNTRGKPEVHSTSFDYVHKAMRHLQHRQKYHLTCTPHGPHVLVYIKHRGRPPLIWNHRCTQQVEYDDILNKISHNNSAVLCRAEGGDTVSDNQEILAVRSQRSVTTKASHLMLSLNTLVHSSFKYNQQDATLYNILYYCQYSTCFRLFLRPSSGAQNCTYSIWYVWSLLAATASNSSKQAWHIPDAVCTVLSSRWWAEKSPETRRALTVIKNIV
jgi:hypothetical protein